MSKPLVGLCTQLDRSKESLDHCIKHLGHDIEVFFWAGLLYQIAHDKNIQEHIIKNYKEVYIYGHRNCAYYDYMDHDGPRNELQQNLDIHYLKGLFFEDNNLSGKINFIEQKRSNIIIDDCEYSMRHENNLVDCVLVYPIEYWQNSQNYIKNVFKTEKMDQYGYFSEGCASIDNYFNKMEKELIDISVNKHGAKKVIFLVKDTIERNSKIISGFNAISDRLVKEKINSSVFSVTSKTKEYAKA